MIKKPHINPSEPAATHVGNSFSVSKFDASIDMVRSMTFEYDLLPQLLELKKEYSEAIRGIGTQKDFYAGKHLRCCKHRNGFQYYIYDSDSDEKLKYCSTKSPAIGRIAQRDYDKELKDVLSERIREIDRFLAKFSKKSPTDVFESRSEGLKRYVVPTYIDSKHFSSIWENEEYNKKFINPDFQYQITDNKEPVRSKSEAMIANTLKRLGIPYRYECAIIINGITIHPDFTVLNPRSGRMYYWEHIGMVDDKQYMTDALKRIQNYESAGIAVGKNLIITAESSGNPLTANKIESAIKLYFH